MMVNGSDNFVSTIKSVVFSDCVGIKQCTAL